MEKLIIILHPIFMLISSTVIQMIPRKYKRARVLHLKVSSSWVIEHMLKKHHFILLTLNIHLDGFGSIWIFTFSLQSLWEKTDLLARVALAVCLHVSHYSCWSFWHFSTQKTVQNKCVMKALKHGIWILFFYNFSAGVNLGLLMICNMYTVML